MQPVSELKPLFKAMDRYNTFVNGGTKIVANVQCEIKKTDLAVDPIGVIGFIIGYKKLRGGRMCIHYHRRQEFYVHPEIVEKHKQAIKEKYPKIVSGFDIEYLIN